MFNIKFTPETFFMLPFALMLDLIGIILIFFGLDDFGITDIIGIAFINTWLLLRGKKALHKQGKKGAINGIKNAFTGKTSKFFTASILELIPYLGCLPFWTLSVLYNLEEE
ncbi:MAG TPA: hypothetical protein PLD14_00930 [Candidatus Pacearchaeota archaeon]|nr:hypothetical protein [Candidatus Pacearchaeota archaeon]HPR79763.1 hypothetical protein [Candidatus Pacearchaeota archaeon]